MGRIAISIRCLLLLLPGCMALGEDFKLSDGTVLRGVRVLEVRPDALVVAHDKGVAMADLDKLPKPVRARYGYDARKAAAFRERDAASRRTAAEENHRLVAAYEERKRAAARAEWEAANNAGTPSSNGGEIRFTPRESAADRAFSAGVAGIGGQIAQGEEARVAAHAPTTFWTAPFWKHPVVQVLGKLLGAGGGDGGRDPASNSQPRNWR